MGDAIISNWVSSVSAGLAPVAEAGGYINFLAPQETDRVQLAFGRSKEKLRELKRKYNPNDILRAATGRLD